MDLDIRRFEIILGEASEWPPAFSRFGRVCLSFSCGSFILRVSDSQPAYSLRPGVSALWSALTRIWMCLCFLACLAL